MRKIIFLLFLAGTQASAQTINYRPPLYALATSGDGGATFAPYTAASGVGSVNYVPSFFVPMCSSTGAPPFSQCTLNSGSSSVGASGAVQTSNGSGGFLDSGVTAVGGALTAPTSVASPVFMGNNNSFTSSNGNGGYFTHTIGSAWTDAFGIEVLGIRDFFNTATYLTGLQGSGTNPPGAPTQLLRLGFGSLLSSFTDCDMASSPVPTAVLEVDGCTTTKVTFAVNAPTGQTADVQDWTVNTVKIAGVTPSGMTALQFSGLGSAPTIANGAAAGTSPGTPSISGTNVSGRISITTGTATIPSATLATVTFAGTVTTAPQGCTIQPASPNAVGQVTMVYTTYPTTTTWTISVAGSPIPASTTFTYSYQCI